LPIVVDVINVATVCVCDLTFVFLLILCVPVYMFSNVLFISKATIKYNDISIQWNLAAFLARSEDSLFSFFSMAQTPYNCFISMPAIPFLYYKETEKARTILPRT
jgi:hypothetical protein